MEKSSGIHEPLRAAPSSVGSLLYAGRFVLQEPEVVLLWMVPRVTNWYSGVIVFSVSLMPVFMLPNTVESSDVVRSAMKATSSGFTVPPPLQRFVQETELTEPVVAEFTPIAGAK